MNENQLTTLNHCPADLAKALHPYLVTPSFDASFSAEDINALQQASGLTAPQLALALLPLAASYALAPLSNFQVGAIAHGASGRWYLGANMEFPDNALQQTVHAEQSAITHAWLREESTLSAVTVNYTPCGHCRQFMNELNCAKQLQIHLPNQPVHSLHHYLPHAFGPHDLGITKTMFDAQRCSLTAHPDPFVQAASDAASQSYAPYTHAYSGIALDLGDEQWITGRYAENAAFNPSLAPLQSALIRLQLAGRSVSAIRRAVLVEVEGARLSQYATSAAMLNTLGNIPFEHVTLSIKS